MMTERAEADSLGIADGTMLIGDSVALRANICCSLLQAIDS